MPKTHSSSPQAQESRVAATSDGLRGCTLRVRTEAKAESTSIPTLGWSLRLVRVGLEMQPKCSCWR